MNQGSVESARTLATERWYKSFNFDLAEESWDTVFSTYDCRDILQAVTIIKRTTRSTKPAVIYSHFESVLKGLNEKRFPTWPPSDMIQN
ncbi:MAG: hypothetical protein ABR880_20885 [Candidatus Sulfotelmatobacter sp.]|jgi:hypothetical protein